MTKHYITDNHIVYYLEEEYLPSIKMNMPIIKAGYYMASYKPELPNGTPMNIVTNGPVSSLVVRHLHDEDMFLTYEDAKEALKQRLLAIKDTLDNKDQIEVIDRIIEVMN